MKTGVLLMAHGSPDSVDQMEEYLRHVMTRRPPTPQFVAEMQGRYRQIGGRSPLLDITCEQAAELSHELAMPVYVGMRHWSPFIKDTVDRARREGIQRLIGLALAPHYADVSVGAYHRVLREAAGDIELVLIKSWATEPHLLDLWSSRLEPGVNVLFTAHSVPVEGAEPYPTEVQATIRGILDRVPVKAHFAWQSKSPSPIPWLGPEIPEVLPRLKGQEVVVAPVGFIADHVEVLYDLDILHRAQAQEFKIDWTRVPMPNNHPLLVQALAETVRANLR